jgi:hypothetical protein
MAPLPADTKQGALHPAKIAAGQILSSGYSEREAIRKSVPFCDFKIFVFPAAVFNKAIWSFLSSLGFAPRFVFGWSIPWGLCRLHDFGCLCKGFFCAIKIDIFYTKIFLIFFLACAFINALQIQNVRD